MRLLRLTCTSLFVSLCLAAPQKEEGADLDALINNVFNKEQPTTNLNTASNSDSGNIPGNVRPNLLGESTTSTTILGTENRKENPDDCICVPYYQCQNGSILDNGIGLIDIRLHGPCMGYLDVCCKPPNVIKLPEDKITPRPNVRKGCGQHNPEGVGFRITGHTNDVSQFGEFPWMVAILKEEDISGNGQKLNVYQCGGSLIHRQAVLTAAHCVNGKAPNTLKIRAGEWDTQTKNEIYPHQDRDVEAVIIHQDFKSGSLHNDFAVLILKTPVDLAENVDVICLPDQGARFDGSRCLASGWGKDVFGKEGKYQVLLKRTELPIVQHDTCQNVLRTTRLGSYFNLDRSFICAGGEPGKDTCKGDGGSPLVCPLADDPTRYVQAGIVAWGIGCGENLIPGVYADVAFARSWIDNQIDYYNFDRSAYQYRP